MPVLSSTIHDIPEFISAPFAEKIVSIHIDLWKQSPPIPDTYTNDGLRSILLERLYNFLMYDPFIAIGITSRPPYFNIEIEKSILDLIDGGNAQAYLDSQILFIVAKHCFMKRRGLYDKIKLIADLNDFYVFISSMRNVTQSTNWFNSYVTLRMEYINRLEMIINNHYDNICTLLTTYNTFDDVDDIYVYLSSKNHTVDSLNYVYAISLGSDPFNSDDEELVFKADEIINDIQFSTKTISSYGILNGLKRITGIKTTSFYNFYTPDESIRGEGDTAVNSSNYYDIASAYRCMPRYIKLTWNPIQGNKGINTIIVPVSGNISDISEVQVLNEYYFSQTFKKDSNVISYAPALDISTAPTTVSSTGDFSTSLSFVSSSIIHFIAPSVAISTIPIIPRGAYITICSSSMNKFNNSEFWNKMIHEFNNRETKDIIDNMIFITDHNLLRKRSDESPKLQYVGYLIHKYEWYDNKWKLKEIVVLDDCRSSYYYDFNILYNRRYKYKMSSLIKWIYSTSLVEVESYYSDARFSDLGPPTDSESTVLPIGSTISESAISTTVGEAGLSIMGSSDDFQARIDRISGEIAREDEETRIDSVDTLESTIEVMSQRIVDMFGST